MTPPTRDGRPASGDAVVRRPPFSVNPTVGARGQRTQQRILDAAVKVFDEVGYHQCSIAHVTELAGCSRVTFYQYFSSKEDVFRTLTGQVARQLNASDARLDPITPDAAGWQVIRDWAERYAEIRDRYEPVFRAFEAAAQSDTVVAEGSAVTNRKSITALRSKVVDSALPAKPLDTVVGLLLGTVAPMLDATSRLADRFPEGFATTAVLDAFADITHRTLFGFDAAMNVHGRPTPPPPAVPIGPTIRAALDRADDDLLASGDGPSVARIVEAAREEFISRGYHGTRVDDIVARAGCSHGLFYRYFENREQLVHLLGADAIRTVSRSLAGIPPAHDDAEALRDWLREYGRAQYRETAVIRVWMDATYSDVGFRAETATMLDWGRRRMARFLQGRSFGDPEIDGIVLLGLVDSFGAHSRTTAELDAAVRVLETGFLGRG